MNLELCRAGTKASANRELPTFHVVKRETVVGRIHQQDDSKTWVWTLYTQQRSDNAAGTAESLDQALSNFKQAWCVF